MTNLLQNQQRLRDMDKRVELYAQHSQGQQLQIRHLEQVINT
jgi:hypothetical protein